MLKSPKKEKDAARVLVLKSYKEGKISLGKAAKQLELNKRDA